MSQHVPRAGSNHRIGGKARDGRNSRRRRNHLRRKAKAQLPSSEHRGWDRLLSDVLT